MPQLGPVLSVPPPGSPKEKLSPLENESEPLLNARLPPLMTKLAAGVQPPPVNESLPALTVIGPVQAGLLERVSVPLPDWVKPPVPLMAPNKVWLMLEL